MMGFRSLIKISNACFAICALVILLTISDTIEAQENPTCTPPSSLTTTGSGQQIEFEANSTDGRRASLDEIDFWAKLGWSAPPILPGLASQNVKIHLYNVEAANSLAEYDDIDRAVLVRFFLVCEDGDQYAAIPATVSTRSNAETVAQSQSGSENTTDSNGTNRYVGMTIRLENIEPTHTLKGDLRALYR